MSIEFTQWVRPKGNCRIVLFESDPETELLAQEIIDSGYYFSVEKISETEVCISVEAEHPLDDAEPGDGYWSTIVVNGPPLLEEIPRFVQAMHQIIVGDS